MTPRAKKIYKLLKKHGELYVREICEKVDMRNQTVEKCLEELVELGKATFQERQNRKCYSIRKKGAMSHQEIQEATEENLARIKKMQKQAIQMYQNRPDSSTFGILVNIGELIIQELTKFEIYESNVDEKNRLKRWKEEQHELRKLLLELMEVDFVAIRTALKAIHAVKTSTHASRIEKSIKELSIGIQPKIEEN